MDKSPSSFIENIIEKDIAEGKASSVATRFPPEPNGYLHIGHVMASSTNYFLAKKYNGTFNLRFDDTNPAREDEHYIKAIEKDLDWLGIKPDKVCYASNYFDQFFEWAKELILAGKAYVDSQSAQEIKVGRGTPTEPGTDSPFRSRSPQENMALFEEMASGKMQEGEAVLRAKIDMKHENILMRDPIMYRIILSSHHKTGNAWKIYPLYDFAHGYEDSIEHITHSLCSLEFVNHRPLYDWFLDNITPPSRPRQYEWSRLAVTHTVMSKRTLKRLVDTGLVDGWDDQRMPTVAGLRKRGYKPEWLIDFCRRSGITRTPGTVQLESLEAVAREALNSSAPRYMAVIIPLKVIITNYPEEKTEELSLQLSPEELGQKAQKMTFSREIYIEREDFAEQPSSKFFRLAPGKEVRLKGGYYITGTCAVKNAAGEIDHVEALYDPQSAGGTTPDGRKVKATIHWLSESNATPAIFERYRPLFKDEHPDIEQDLKTLIDPLSKQVFQGYVTKELSKMRGVRVQLLRLGYFWQLEDQVTEEQSALPRLTEIVSLKGNSKRKS